MIKKRSYQVAVELQGAVSLPVLPRLRECWGGTRQHSCRVMDGIPQANS